MLLAMAERIAKRLAGCFADRRDPLRIIHADMIRARIFAVSCGYEDADDLDFLRTDPAFKLAYGRLPDTGAAGERASPEGRDPNHIGASGASDAVASAAFNRPIQAATSPDRVNRPKARWNMENRYIFATAPLIQRGWNTTVRA
jgi:hypothetical protein